MCVVLVCNHVFGSECFWPIDGPYHAVSYRSDIKEEINPCIWFMSVSLHFTHLFLTPRG